MYLCHFKLITKKYLTSESLVNSAIFKNATNYSNVMLEF
jgi:hypothetical protein